MNRAFSTFVKSLFVALFAVSSIAIAAEEKKAPQVKKADPAKGEALYANGDAARNITACLACHGAAGNSTISANPKLAAQHESYTYKQLTNFKGAERNQPIMSPIAKNLTDDDIKNIAAYLETQKLKPAAAKASKEVNNIGKKIYRAGIAEKNVPACAGCHGPNGAGIPAQFARIGGQHQEYTANQLFAFRKDRKNSEQMTTIAKRLSDDEINAVADYIAGLR